MITEGGERRRAVALAQVAILDHSGCPAPNWTNWGVAQRTPLSQAPRSGRDVIKGGLKGAAKSMFEHDQ